MRFLGMDYRMWKHAALASSALLGAIDAGAAGGTVLAMMQGAILFAAIADGVLYALEEYL